MKIAGMIGGTGPESTIEYYRRIIAGYRATTNDGSTPPIIINSVNMSRIIDSVSAGRYHEVTDFLAAEVQRLAAAGANFAFLSANTPHIVFDELRERSPLPMISIVEAACTEAKARGLQRLGLLGTRFTMQADFYPKAFSRAGIEIVAPPQEIHGSIHEIYMGELVRGVVLPESREKLAAIVREMKETDRIEGVILGGTELSLMFTEPQLDGLPVLDTTAIHVRTILSEMLA